MSKRVLFTSGLIVAALAFTVVTVIGKHRTYASGMCGSSQTAIVAMPQSSSNTSCQLLNGTPMYGQANTYGFTTSAAQINGTTPVMYVYNFGDGTPTITETDGTTQATHAYAAPGAYTATVTMYANGSGQGSVVPFATCSKQIIIGPQTTNTTTTPPAATTAQVASSTTYDSSYQPAQSAYVQSTSTPSVPYDNSGECGQFTQSSSGTNSAGQQVINFTASSQIPYAATTGVSFYFGDGTEQFVPTDSGISATASHAYASPGTYYANVIFSFTMDGGGFQNSVPCDMIVVVP